MMQRREWKASRNAGFSLTVSARALIIRLPIAGSLAQAGIRPRCTRTASRSPALPARILARSGLGRLDINGTPRARRAVEPRYGDIAPGLPETNHLVARAQTLGTGCRNE